MFMFTFMSEPRARPPSLSPFGAAVKIGGLGKKKQISVTMWYYRPPGATKYYLGGGPHREYPLSWALMDRGGSIMSSASGRVRGHPPPAA